MSEARHSPPRGRAGREVDYYHEKGNLENGDSTGDISSHRSSNHPWCDKLHVIAQERASPILNGLYTPFGSPVPGGQKPQKGRANQLAFGGGLAAMFKNC